MKYTLVFLLGWLTSVPCYLFWQALQEPTAEEAVIEYRAYKSCIARSNCKMTPRDWIDYYDLKWRLESE
jgi:hypothetical protein